jgi:superfamily II DNA or RNA helicase
MTEITLRDYQQKAIDDITEVAVTGKKRILLQLPCGSGKTVLASKIIQHAVSNGNKVLFLAHRRELVHQTVEKLGYFGVEAAEMISGTPYVYCFPVVVA